MTVTAERARELLYAAHDAWNVRDTERLVSLFVDDMTYWSNAGGPDGGELTIRGKDAFRKQLRAWSGSESISVPQHFRFDNGLGRASIEFYVRDSESGHKYVGTYRQIATYRDNKILRFDIYHDASALAAFLELASRKETPQG